MSTTPTLSHRARTTQDSPIRKLSATAEARKRTGVKVFHLNIGQPDLPTPPVVFETIRELRMSTLAYAPSNGVPQAVDAWRTYFRGFGIELDEKELIVTTGGSEAIVFALLAVCDHGDEVIVFEPFYTNYNGFAAVAGVKLVPIPLRIEDGFRLPPADAIERHVTPRTRAILVCSPSNPTGTVVSREEMARLADVAARRGLFLLSDEVYREFAYAGPAASVLSFPEIADRAVLLDSTSKRFNVCGARIGALASRNRDVVQAALRFGMARLSVATIEQLAVAPLLRSAPTYTAPIVEEFRRRRDAVVEGLRAVPGVTSYRPEGAFYIMIGLPVDDSERFSRWLIEEFEHERETVLLAPGPGFYATPGRGRNEARLAFMLNVDDLRRALSILGVALETYSKRR